MLPTGDARAGQDSLFFLAQADEDRRLLGWSQVSVPGPFTCDLRHVPALEFPGLYLAFGPVGGNLPRHTATPRPASFSMRAL